MKKNVHVIIGLILIFAGLLTTITGLTNIGFKFENGSFRGEIIKGYYYDVVELKGIVYEGHVGDIEVKRTSTEFIKVTTINSSGAKLELKDVDNILYIKQSEVNIIGNKKCNIIVEMPKDKTIDLTVNVNVGEVEIENSSVDNINISINVGDVEIENAYFTNLNVVVSVGDIDINTPDTKNNYVINGEGSGSKTINAITKYGELNIN